MGKSPTQEILLLRGARQVGKTYITRELGKEFPRFVEVNLELSPKIKQVFHYDLDVNRIIHRWGYTLLSTLFRIQVKAAVPGTAPFFNLKPKATIISF